MANMRPPLARTLNDIPSIAAMERIPEYRNFVGNWTEDEHRARLASDDCRYLAAESGSGELALDSRFWRGLHHPIAPFGCRGSWLRSQIAALGSSCFAASSTMYFTSQKRIACGLTSSKPTRVPSMFMIEPRLSSRGDSSRGNLSRRRIPYPAAPHVDSRSRVRSCASIESRRLLASAAIQTPFFCGSHTYL